MAGNQQLGSIEQRTTSHVFNSMALVSPKAIKSPSLIEMKELTTERIKTER